VASALTSSFLDYKKDYVSPDFVAATGAKVIKPFHMPINVFDS
jgi:hypothetical protein